MTVVPGDNRLVDGLGGPNGYGELDLTTRPLATGGSLDDGFWPLDVSAVFPDGIDFFGTRYDAASQLFVGTNGYITFRGGYSSFTPEGIPSMNVPIISVFFADQDFRGGGHAWVSMDTNPTDPTLTLTYEGVPAFPSTDLTKLNSYQIRLHNTGGNATDGDGVAIEFRYNRIDYLDGEASRGTFATAGWADGNGSSGNPTQVFGEVVGSGTAAMALNATADVTYSNLVPPQAGVYVWKPLQIHARAVSSPQSALPGRAFPQPLIVDVTDDSGVPVAGATVKFAPPVGGATASVVSRTAVTDASGTAQVEAYAGVVTGDYSVQAFVVSGGYSVPVTFELTNLEEPPLTVLLDEGFESGLGGWTTATDSGSSFWHVLTSPENLRISPALVPSVVSLPDAGYHLAAVGGTHVAWFGDGSTGSYLGGDYPSPQVAKGGGTSAAVQAGSLVTPSLDLTGYSAATLEFDSWWEIEGADPGADDRMSLTAVSGGVSTPLTLLNPTFHTTTPAAVAVSSGGIAATPVWRHYVVDLSGVTGRAIQLRFGFDSVTTSANAFRGWSLDDVVVRGGTEVPAPSVASISPAVGTAGDVVVVTGTSFAQGARFYIDSTEVTAVTVMGSTTAYLEVPAVAEGLHDVTVQNPDGKLNIAPDAFTYTSTASPAIASLTPASAPPSTAQVITITGAGVASAAHVLVGGQEGSHLTVVDADTIQVTLPGLAEGTYTVQVMGATGQTGTAYAAYVVARQPVTVTIDAASLSATYDGAAKEVTATTTPEGLPVTVYYDGSTTAPTAAGSYAVVAAVDTAQYQGADTGTLVIGKAEATVTLGSLSATYDGSAHAATATTSPSDLTVNLTYDGGATAPTHAGTYAVVGTVSDVNYQGSASGSLVLAQAAQAISFTPPAVATYGAAGIDLSGHASGGASGNPVTFSVVSGPGALSGTTLGFTGAGDLVIRASQAASGDYLAAADVDATIAVAPGDASVALASQTASPVAGQAVSFTVTVTGAGTPSGTVAVQEGGVTLATGTLGGGAATLVVAGGFHAGAHALTATYAGDGQHAAAAPASLELSVGRAGTAVALASSRADASVDQPVTLRATVSAAAPGAGTPTGTVTFTEGATTLGTRALSGGTASLTIPSFSHGTHAIAAAYDGDTDFLAGAGSLSGGQVVPASPPVAGAGKAVAFDGVSQDARVEDPDDALSAAHTVELWFSAAAGDAPACLVQRGEGSDLRFGLCLTAGRDGLEVRRGSEVTPVSLAIPAGWHHLALVDGGTATTLFLDGQEAASLEGGFGSGAAPADVSQPAAGPALAIGAAPAGSGATDRFPGAVDEVRLWSTARTADELAAEARQPVSGAAEGLLALWRMDEGEGASLYDAGPSHLVAALSASGQGTWVDSGAWRLRTTQEERALPAFLAGYDPDGEAFTVTVVAAPAHGTATVDGASINYTPAPGFVGTDTFTCEVSGDGATNRYTTEVSVTHIDVCEVTTDCAGGDECKKGLCVPPSGSGCGCGSGGGGASLLAALSLLALLPRRRRSR